MKRGLRLLHRGLSTILALCVLGTQGLFAYQPENNFWAERRNGTRRTASTLFASLPLDASSFLNQAWQDSLKTLRALAEFA